MLHEVTPTVLSVVPSTIHTLPVTPSISKNFTAPLWVDPPGNVQETMNEIIMAENTKDAALDFAVAAETKADGEKKATIKQAQGNAQAIELQATAEKNAAISIATGEAQAIKLVNESAQKYFKGQAVELKKLETTRDTLANNTKIIIPKDAPIVDFFAKMAAMKEEKGE